MGLQTKLEVNEPGDSYEQEADRIADQVMSTPAHSAVSGAPLRIQRYTAQLTAQMDAVPASIDRVLAGSGRPLEPALRQDMEQRFGHDFSRVRVHSGAAAEQSARDVNAHAYTVGQRIVFGDGRYAPTTTEGRRLIAHELTHVLQQQAVTPVFHAAHANDYFVQRDTSKGRNRGEKEAVVPLKWVRDGDQPDFVDRLVVLLARTGAFRDIPRDDLRAALMIPAGNFFVHHQLFFQMGQQVQLRVKAWYSADSWNARVEIAEQPVAANEDSGRQIPASPAPRTPERTLEPRAVGMVIQKEGKIHTDWAPKVTKHPDDAKVFGLVMGNWIYRHPGQVPSDHSELMEFMQVSGKWGLGPYSNWHAPEVPTLSAAPHHKRSPSEEFEFQVGEYLPGIVYPQKKNKLLYDVGVQGLKESNPFSLKNLPYTIAGVVIPIGAMKLITMDAGELSGLVRLEWQIDDALVLESELEASVTPSAARPGLSRPTSTPRNTQVGDIIDSPKGPQRVLQIEPGRLVTEPYVEPQAAPTANPPPKTAPSVTKTAPPKQVSPSAMDSGSAMGTAQKPATSPPKVQPSDDSVWVQLHDNRVHAYNPSEVKGRLKAGADVKTPEGEGRVIHVHEDPPYSSQVRHEPIVKPKYENPGHHDWKSGRPRGGGSKTTPLPSDAEDVFTRAIAGDPDGKTWYGKNANGDIYRFQADRNGKAHFNGSSNSERGLDDIPRHVLDQLGEK
jgi:hypothetical protein